MRWIHIVWIWWHRLKQCCGGFCNWGDFSQEATVTEGDTVTLINLDPILPVIQCFYYLTCLFPSFWVIASLVLDENWVSYGQGRQHASVTIVVFGILDIPLCHCLLS